MSDRDQVLRDVLTLPPSDRLYIVDAVDRSLADGGLSEVADSSPPDAEALLEAWSRRSAAHRTCSSSARDAADVLADQRHRQAEERRP